MSRPSLQYSDMAELSGSDLSKTESDIYQTISLAGTVVTLIREPISLLYNNINKTKKLKQSLGAWCDDALDENGQSQIPVLQRLEYEDHLVSTDGMVQYPIKSAEEERGWMSRLYRAPQPSGVFPELPKAGAACWSYFLYALGIHPGKGVVDWKPSMDGYINTQNGGVEMEIDGPALCHIINLYSTIPDSTPWARRSEEEIPNRHEAKLCTFPFGELAWNTVNGKIHAHFKPGVEKELANTKIPFGKVGSKMEPGTLIASYLTALNHGVSDASFQLADVSAPLSQRADKLVKCFQELDEWVREPLIISREWFEEAARVKRRVLAEGGSNRSFYDDISKAIDGTDKFDDDEKDELKEIVRNRFFFGKDSFHFYLPGGSSLSVSMTFEHAYGLIKKVLESYKDHPSGSWKRTLYEIRDKVQQVLKIHPNVYAKDWLSLQEFDRSCELWREKVLLGAPVLATD